MELSDKLQDLLKVLMPEIAGSIEMRVEGEEMLLVAPEENLGMIIGKGGKTAKALRELVFLYNKSHNTNHRLTIRSHEELAGGGSFQASEESTSDSSDFSGDSIEDAVNAVDDIL